MRHGDNVYNVKFIVSVALVTFSVKPIANMTVSRALQTWPQYKINNCWNDFMQRALPPWPRSHVRCSSRGLNLMFIVTMAAM